MEKSTNGMDQKGAHHMVKKAIPIPILVIFLISLLACRVMGASDKGGLKKEPPLQDEVFTNSIGMEFKLIPAGSFIMGSPTDEKGRDPDEGIHRVEIEDPFYLGIYEVTQAQWRTVMGNSPSFFKGDALPVEQVSWDEVLVFIQKLNARENTDKYRLPMEAEWEYACRSGTNGPFSSGICLSTMEGNYNGNYPYSGCMKGEYPGKTLPVGSLQPNAFGLYDMHGNVGEWCQDRYGKDSQFSGSPHDSPTPTAIIQRVIRGGGWYLPAYLCRSAHRGIYRQNLDCDAIGFRLLKMP
jgi:formylglycine-generating enzyme required for sulfatase activity